MADALTSLLREVDAFLMGESRVQVTLTRANELPAGFDAELDASVREKYRELWAAAQRPLGPDQLGGG